MPASRRLRSLRTDELGPNELSAIRTLLDEAFREDEHGGFGDDDWRHALGGQHFVLEQAGEIVGHASVVHRELRIAGRPVRTGYVEAVATSPRLQHTGIGTAVMTRVNAHIAERYELGALGTGSHAFYERLGWRTWRGPSSVRKRDGERATPDEDGYIMVLPIPASPPPDLDAPISCEWRPGDVW